MIHEVLVSKLLMNEQDNNRGDWPAQFDSERYTEGTETVACGLDSGDWNNCETNTKAEQYYHLSWLCMNVDWVPAGVPIHEPTIDELISHDNAVLCNQCNTAYVPLNAMPMSFPSHYVSWSTFNPYRLTQRWTRLSWGTHVKLWFSIPNGFERCHCVWWTDIRLYEIHWQGSIMFPARY